MFRDMLCETPRRIAERNTRMQNEFDDPDESEWDEEEPYYDWDDEAVGNMGDTSQCDAW